jgi:hypothetical protein
MFSHTGIESFVQLSARKPRRDTCDEERGNMSEFARRNFLCAEMTDIFWQNWSARISGDDAGLAARGCAELFEMHQE